MLLKPFLNFQTSIRQAYIKVYLDKLFFFLVIPKATECKFALKVGFGVIGSYYYVTH